MNYYPVRFVEVKPIEIHYYYPFIHRGLEDIIRKIGAEHIDWKPEDVYTAIRNATTKLVIAMRGERFLGWFSYYIETRGWSGNKHLLIWHVWARPMNERLPYDNIGDAIRGGLQTLKDIAREDHCDSLVMMTSAKIKRAWRRYGFEPGVTSWRLPL